MNEMPKIRVRGEAAGITSHEDQSITEEVLKGLREHTRTLSPERKTQLQMAERPKTPEELEYISLANDASNKILRRYGMPAFDIPPDNIHIISDPKVFQEIAGVAVRARAIHREWTVYLGDAEQFGNSQLARATTIFHEILHLKNALAVRVHVDHGALRIGEYQEGVSVMKKPSLQRENEPVDYFQGLNEAINATLEHEYKSMLRTVPSLRLEWHTTKHLAKSENVKSYLQTKHQRQDELLSAHEYPRCSWQNKA